MGGLGCLSLLGGELYHASRIVPGFHLYSPNSRIILAVVPPGSAFVPRAANPGSPFPRNYITPKQRSANNTSFSKKRRRIIQNRQAYTLFHMFHTTRSVLHPVRASE